MLSISCTTQLKRSRVFTSFLNHGFCVPENAFSPMSSFTPPETPGSLEPGPSTSSAYSSEFRVIAGLLSHIAHLAMHVGLFHRRCLYWYPTGRFYCPSLLQILECRRRRRIPQDRWRSRSYVPSTPCIHTGDLFSSVDEASMGQPRQSDKARESGTRVLLAVYLLSSRDTFRDLQSCP